MLGPAGNQLLLAVDTLRRRPIAAAFLRDTTGTVRDAALAALRTGSASPNTLGTQILDVSGHLVLSTRDGLPIPTALPSATDRIVGPLGMMRGTIVVYSVGRVSDQGETLGYVVRWWQSSTSDENRGRFQALIGPGSALFLANADGSLWTDLLRRVEARPFDPSAGEPVRYENPDGSEALAAASPIPGTPWMVVVQFPMDRVLEGVTGMLRWLLLFGVFILVAGGITAWILSGRLTRSIGELATAARAIRAGDYGRRVAVHGSDELGTGERWTMAWRSTPTSQRIIPVPRAGSCRRGWYQPPEPGRRGRGGASAPRAFASAAR
jgi:HAMP domain-containing protein